MDSDLVKGVEEEMRREAPGMVRTELVERWADTLATATAEVTWIRVANRAPACDMKPGSLGVPVFALTDEGDLKEAFYGCRITPSPSFYYAGVVVPGVVAWLPAPPHSGWKRGLQVVPHAPFSPPGPAEGEVRFDGLLALLAHLRRTCRRDVDHVFEIPEGHFEAIEASVPAGTLHRHPVEVTDEMEARARAAAAEHLHAGELSMGALANVVRAALRAGLVRP